MSFLRFNHVFTALMLIAFASAFFVPQNLTGIGRAHVQNVFAPVASPMRTIAAAVHDRFAGRESVDPGSPDHPRNVDQLRRENDELRQLAVSLGAQLEHLKELNADRNQLGEVRKFCTPFRVFSSDTGLRQSLNLKGSSYEGLKQDMPVICPAGLVGKLNRTGVAGASVRLVTDQGFRVQAVFGRWSKDGQRVVFQILDVQPFVLQGTGNGAMGAKLINFTQLKKAGVQLNDWVVLHDPDWPAILQHTRVGRVVQIGTQPDGPGYAEVRVEPVVSLMQLRDVMVMNRDGGEGQAARGD